VLSSEVGADVSMVEACEHAEGEKDEGGGRKLLRATGNHTGEQHTAPQHTSQLSCRAKSWDECLFSNRYRRGEGGHSPGEINH